MPPKKGTKGKKKGPRHSDEEELSITPVDVQYNPDIVNGMLQDLEAQVEAKCLQIQKDIDFMATSMLQSYHLELIKLPTQVKQMTLQRFREEYGDSLDAVNRIAISTKAPGSIAKNKNKNSLVYATPASSKMRNGPQGTAMRAPREGEQILSKNGSPLGQFTTVVKAPKPNAAPPSTPGIFVPLSSGDVIDVSNVESLPEEVQQDALIKMQMMMNNMQTLMQKMNKAWCS